jgi:hypothetical protein
LLFVFICSRCGVDQNKEQILQGNPGFVDSRLVLAFDETDAYHEWKTEKIIISS